MQKGTIISSDNPPEGRRVINVSVLCYTDDGSKLTIKVAEAMQDIPGIYANVSIYEYGRNFTDTFRLLEDNFYTNDVLVFLSATGIAVRTTAPFIRSKTSDPAVIVIDDKCRFVISLLSGHIGGANAFTQILADKLNACPVITTASDSSKNNSHVSLDIWAAANGYHISDMRAARRIAARMLDGLVPTVSCENGVYRICINQESSSDLKKESDMAGGSVDAEILLSPRPYVVGVGCRRGTNEDILYEAVHEVLAEHEISDEDVFRLCSVDLKAEEAGLKRLADTMNVEFRVYTAEELNALSGEFSRSEFVVKTAGTDCVCERSAVAGCMVKGFNKSRLIQKKISGKGVTVAVAERILI